MCERWGKDYRAFKLMRNNADYKAYMTYLNYAPEIQSMIYTTNWDRAPQPGLQESDQNAYSHA